MNSIEFKLSTPSVHARDADPRDIREFDKFRVRQVVAIHADA